MKAERVKGSVGSGHKLCRPGLVIGWVGLMFCAAFGPAEPTAVPVSGGIEATTVQPPAHAQDVTLAILTFHDDMIDDVTTSSLERRAEQAIAEGAEILVLEMDTPGGLVSSSVDIAQYLRDLSENRGIKVVSWVRKEAISGGTLVSMACDEIIMSRSSTLGDCGVILMGAGGASTAQDPALDAKIESYVLAVFDSAAARNGYDPLLCDSFVKYEVEVWWLEHSVSGERRFADGAEKDKLLDKPADIGWVAGQDQLAGKWQLVESYIDPRDGQQKKLRQPVVPDDKLLTIDQSMAQVLGFSKALVRDETELAARYGQPHNVTLPRYEQTWSEELASTLTSPVLRMILIALIGLGAYTEFQSPGLGLPGLVAVLALVMFLGAPYLTGLANIWEIVVIALGVSLLLTEVFLIPGFGVAGISGMLLLIVGLLATFMPEEPGKMPLYWPELPQSFDGLKWGVVSLAGGITMALVGMFALSRFLPQIPYLKHVVPANPTASAVALDDPYTGLASIGDIGCCESGLRPAGKARFAGQLVDVVSEGEMLPGGTQVEVIERHGNRVVVRKVS